MYLKDSLKSQEATDLIKGDYSLLLSSFIRKNSNSISQQSEIYTWDWQINNFLKETAELQDEKLLCLGIAALSLFIQKEWTGPDFDEFTITQVESLTNSLPRNIVVSELIADADDISPVSFPHLLHFSLAVFEKCSNLYSNSICTQIWLIRGLFIQQLILEEKSPMLHGRIETLLENVTPLITNKEQLIPFLLERARIRLFYEYVEKSCQDIDKAAELAGLSYGFTGAMGRRTHYQQHDLAQLVMEVDLASSGKEEREESVKNDVDGISSAFPKLVPLEDDVRMEQIKLANPSDSKSVSLSQQHVAILLAVLMLRRKSMPEDELSVEESRTIVQRLLQNQGAWAVQLSALLVRSHLERSSRRTVERAMLQVQAVLDDLQDGNMAIKERQIDFFVSYLPTKREIESTLADFLLSLGAVKSALDICLRLQNWELAIACYNELQLRHKAKELIEQELAKGETTKLWCLLGDATDDTTCYQKAWQLSKERSARAQRHWGNYLYTRKKYGESIDHYEKSLNINSLQSTLWFRLGFAALHEEQWELSAKAYRRYCTLENDSFEAWNNLARCYCEMGQKDRAWRALKEALKVDMSNWRVWDNYMRVSADLKEYNEVIRSYNQVLTLKKDNHVDMPLLMSLAHGYFNVIKKNEQGSVRKNMVELITRLTSKPSKYEAELWLLCADVSSLEKSEESVARQQEYLLKAHTRAVLTPRWEQTVESCQRVVDILERLVTFAVDDTSFRNLFLLVAKPSISTITRYHQDSNLCSKLQDAIRNLDDPTNSN